MKIVGIHGIAHTYVTSPQIENEWFPALQGGLDEAIKQGKLEKAKAPQLQKEDFAAVAYGALFRPSGTRSSGIPKLDANDIQTDWEKSLLLDWWREAANLSEANRSLGDPFGEDPSIQGIDFEGRGRTPAVIQRALRQLSKSRFFKALGPERVLIFGLKQVYEYVHNPDRKQEILQRVVEQVTPSTKIIIGHSLGSIVAYEALCAHPEWNVNMLITIGSPLSISNLIFEKLVPPPTNGQGTWPCVSKWVNIADAGDIVALQKELSPQFGPVIDIPINNGWESHSATRYLTTPELGKAIALGLEA